MKYYPTYISEDGYIFVPHELMHLFIKEKIKYVHENGKSLVFHAQKQIPQNECEMPKMQSHSKGNYLK